MHLIEKTEYKLVGKKRGIKLRTHIVKSAALGLVGLMLCVIDKTTLFEPEC